MLCVYFDATTATAAAAVYAPIQREGRRLDKDAAKYDVLSKAAPVTTVQVHHCCSCCSGVLLQCCCYHCCTVVVTATSISCYSSESHYNARGLMLNHAL
jgi:hypothetical protein